jgi:DNA-binding beta-propeller fold protein YncE
VAAALPAQQAWVYVLRADRPEILVVDPRTRALAHTVRLSQPDPVRLFPTPGGKFVFVTYRDTDTLSAVDVEAHTESRTFTLDLGRPQELAFSPMGDTVIAGLGGSNTVAILGHSRSLLEGTERLEVGSAGTPALFNRRATRLYRSSPEGLVIVYRKTGEVISRVSLPHGAMTWAFSPDYRNLWGVALEGAGVVVVDEARARVVDTLVQPHRPHAPVFSPDGARVYLIGATGRAVVAVDTRSRRVAGEIAFPTPVDGIAHGTGTELWASSQEGGVLYVADTRRGQILGRLDLGGPIGQMAWISLKRGEGYACF